MREGNYLPHSDQETKRDMKGLEFHYSPQRHAPSDLTSSYQVPPLKCPTASQQCHKLVAKTLTCGPLKDTHPNYNRRGANLFFPQNALEKSSLSSRLRLGEFIHQLVQKLRTIFIMVLLGGCEYAAQGQIPSICKALGSISSTGGKRYQSRNLSISLCQHLDQMMQKQCRVELLVPQHNSGDQIVQGTRLFSDRYALHCHTLAV